MSLSGSEKINLLGAIRNCQLRKIHFPEWRIRIYMRNPNTYMEQAVPERIRRKLKILGAEIVYIDDRLKDVPEVFWSFLVVDDTNVDRFIIRRPRSRLNGMDALLVGDWVRSQKVMHCIRDHPSHADKPIVEYLWGGVSADVRHYLKTSMAGTLLQHSTRNWSQFMSSLMWPLLKNVSLCHDSLSCDKWTNSVPMPRRDPNTTSYLGQSLGPYGEQVLVDGNVDEYLHESFNNNCHK
jgi:hypothetical protein